jgi:hypothetical protein
MELRRLTLGAYARWEAGIDGHGEFLRLMKLRDEAYLNLGACDVAAYMHLARQVDA